MLSIRSIPKLTDLRILKKKSIYEFCKGKRYAFPCLIIDGMVDMKQLPDTEIAEQVDKAKKAENWTTDEGNGTDYRDIRRFCWC